MNFPREFFDEFALGNAPINVMPGGGGWINVMPGGGLGGREGGGDLIVFVGHGVRHLTDLVLPGEGILKSFFARSGDI